MIQLYPDLNNPVWSRNAKHVTEKRLNLTEGQAFREEIGKLGWETECPAEWSGAGGGAERFENSTAFKI